MHQTEYDEFSVSEPKHFDGNTSFVLTSSQMRLNDAARIRNGPFDAHDEIRRLLQIASSNTNRKRGSRTNLISNSTSHLCEGHHLPPPLKFNRKIKSSIADSQNKN